MLPLLDSGDIYCFAKAAPLRAVVDHWCCWKQLVLAGFAIVSAQRSPLGWAMGSSQRLAAVAAVSHAKHYYNHTQPNVIQTESTHYNINIFFVSATLCGVLVAVCAACCRRPASSDKPEEISECRGVYTVSADSRLTPGHQEELAGPPPAYDIVVADSSQKDSITLQEVMTDGCRCHKARGDSGLPSYEAAVLLKDTKL
ncbi:uncharacterized protein LOC123699279 [Colias croceus]|uniref:uncharacterized protein LOC123699279 n=1 Tax=Colias crocea TaxID=72248 RepID=UPI001E27F7CA|nr:uncharacterized protein LOC123699279 [Colias croceus]